MDLSNWIGIIAIIVLAFTTYHIAIRKGTFVKFKLHFSPSRSTGDTKKKYFHEKGVKKPVIGVVNFIKINTSKHNQVIHHIYFTIENACNYPIENISVVVTFPKKYYDKGFENHLVKDHNISKYNPTEPDRAQYIFGIEELNPNSRVLLPFPILLKFKEVSKNIKNQNPLDFYIKDDTTLSYGMFNYIVTSKNIKNPIRNKFFLVNVLNTPQKIFFSKENKFLYYLMKSFRFKNRVVEIHNISNFEPYNSNTLKSQLVASDDITYKIFPNTIFEPKNILDISEEGMISD